MEISIQKTKPNQPKDQTVNEMKLSFEKDSKSKKIITRRKNGTLRVQTQNNDPSLTDPQWDEKSDINYIMDRFLNHGESPTYGTKKQGIYADVSQIPDLLGAAIIVREAQNNFDSLPSKIREKFHNNPQNMIDFLSDPKNNEEAVELGLLTPLAPKSNDELNDNKKPAPSNKAPKTDPPKSPDQE